MTQRERDLEAACLILLHADVCKISFEDTASGIADAFARVRADVWREVRGIIDALPIDMDEVQQDALYAERIGISGAQEALSVALVRILALDGQRTAPAPDARESRPQARRAGRRSFAAQVMTIAEARGITAAKLLDAGGVSRTDLRSAMRDILRAADAALSGAGDEGEESRRG